MEAMCSSEMSDDLSLNRFSFPSYTICDLRVKIFFSEDRQISVMYFHGGVTYYFQSINIARDTIRLVPQFRPYGEANSKYFWRWNVTINITITLNIAQSLDFIKV
jgi:hypothetical protein